MYFDQKEIDADALLRQNSLQMFALSFYLHVFCVIVAGVGVKVCSGLPPRNKHSIIEVLGDIIQDRQKNVNSIQSMINEPRHDKPNKMSVRPAKTQISLGIRPV